MHDVCRVVDFTLLEVYHGNGDAAVVIGGTRDRRVTAGGDGELAVVLGEELDSGGDFRDGIRFEETARLQGACRGPVAFIGG